MYCKKCGAQNTDDATFCEKCGTELATATPMEQPSGSLGFEEGLTKALRTFGVGVLSDPMRLKASVADECDHGSKEYIVFERNCNPDLLEPYAKAAKENDAKEMERAAMLGTLYLNETRAEDERTSHAVASAVAKATAVVCGMGPLSIPECGPSVGVENQQKTVIVSPPQPEQQPDVTQPSPQTPVQSPAQSPYITTGDGGQSGQKGSKAPIIIGVVAVVAAVAVLIVTLVVVPRVSGGSGSGGTTSSSAASGQNAITISFDGGDADGGMMSALSCNNGESVTAPKCGYTNKGYTFSGWRSSDGKTYAPGDSIKVTDNITLTALWTPDQCTIKFLGAGADGGSTESIITTSGASVTLPTCGFYRDGYDFDCWEDEDGISYDPGDTVTVSGDASFAAQWKARQSSSSSNSSSSSSTSSSSSSSSAIDSNTMPRNWKGSYEGYTTHTADGVITRAVTMDFSTISSDGHVSGIVYVGEAEMIEGVTHGSYNFEGTLDFKTGNIHVYGTTWVDQGGLIGVGGFKGTVNPNNWTMSGEWYDPEGEADNGAWYMRAV